MSRWLFAAPAVLCVGLLTVARGAAPFHIAIVDDASGQPIAAPVYLADGAGNPVVPDGPPAKVGFRQRNWYYTDGRLTISDPPDTLHVDVRRGFETIPETRTVSPGSADRTLTIRLKRWIDMRAEGYMNGDTHVHFLGMGDAHLQLRAEDLNVLNLLTSDFTDDAEKFTGALDPVSTDHAWVYVGQEVRDWQSGHVILMNLRSLFQPIGPAGGRFRNQGTTPNRILAPALRFARTQDAVTSWAHFTNLPGIESPIDAALGLLDAIDLSTINNPTGLPPSIHRDPWEKSGFPETEFAPMRGMELYYQFLNSGLRIPLGAGSDKMGDETPVGNNRFYGRIDGSPSYQAWLDALKAGRGFTTNHPLLFFTVDTHQTGDVVSFTDSKRVRARVTARSLLPFANLEIIVNGNPVVTETTLPEDAKADANGVYTFQAEAEIELSESSWIAARAAPRLDDTSRGILPAWLHVFAHSNPIWFLKDDRPVRIDASRRYLTQYVDGAIHWYSNGADFATEAERTEALTNARKARQFYAED